MTHMGLIGDPREFAFTYHPWLLIAPPPSLTDSCGTLLKNDECSVLSKVSFRKQSRKSFNVCLCVMPWMPPGCILASRPMFPG